MELRSRRSSGEFDGNLVTSPKPVLQTFYYGNIQGKTDQMTPGVGAYGGQLKCGCCCKLFKTSKEIMLHCYGHVQYTVVPGNPEKPQGSCNYCLKFFGTQPLVDAHVQLVHTLSADRFCCRICEITFANKGLGISHMWKKHVELEMPYICEICNFSSSLHTEVIDHFQRDHELADRVLCPFCLKTLTVHTEKCITQIYIHLQSHRVIRNKECLRCKLKFIKDEEYQRHISEAHISRPSNESVRYVLSGFEEAIQMPNRASAQFRN